jgi:hypothetical protein
MELDRKQGGKTEIRLFSAQQPIPLKVISANLVTKFPGGPEDLYFVRAAEVNVGAAIRYGIVACSGPVRSPNFVGSAIFANGPAEIGSLDKGLVVCDSAITVRSGTFSLIIARESITCEGTFAGCTIISGKSIIRKKAALDECCVVENEATPLKFVKFFDPVREGVGVEMSNDGVRVKEVLAGKAFSKAGLEVGDLIRTVNGAPINSVEAFRQLLRRPIATADDLALGIHRKGKALEVRVPTGK